MSVSELHSLVMNHGVGAEGLLAAQSALTDSADNYGNDPRLEQLWAMKAMDHAEVYFNLLCSVDPSRLKLTGKDNLFALNINTLHDRPLQVTCCIFFGQTRLNGALCIAKYTNIFLCL